MKIALVNTVNLEENGISTFILNNSYLFSKWGEDVAIIAPNKVKKAFKKRIISKGIRLIELPMRDNSPQIYFWKLIKVLKKEKYDIVHVNGNSTTMSIELLAAWFAGIKVRIAHSHNTTADHTKINKLLRPIFNLTVNGRVACNIAAGKWLFHQKQFLVIRNGINLSHFHFDESLRENYRKTLKLNKDDILLGNVGRFNRQKNQVVLLDLIKQLGAIVATIFVLLWQGVAMPIIIFLAGLQSIPDEIKEAAAVDGANSKQIFWHIELPYMLPSISMVFIMALKSGLTAFDQIFAMTGGGPNNSTTSLGLLVYNYAFNNNSFGYAYAVAIVLFILIAIVSFIQIKISNRYAVD